MHAHLHTHKHTYTHIHIFAVICIFASLTAGSAASDAGLKRYDCIVRINGQNVSRSTAESVARIVRWDWTQELMQVKANCLIKSIRGYRQCWVTNNCEALSDEDIDSGLWKIWSTKCRSCYWKPRHIILPSMHMKLYIKFNYLALLKG